MKKFALVLAFLMGAGSAHAQRWGSPVTALSAVATTGASSALDTSGATAVLFHVTGAPATASVELRQSVGGSAWNVAATIANPDAGGELWACPAAPWASVNVASRSAGTVTATIATRSLSGEPISSCRKLSASSNTFGALSVTALTDTGLTSGRVPIASTGGLLADSSAFTFSAGTLSATTFAGAFSGSTVTASGAVTAPTFVGALQDTITAKATNGAIASAPGTIVITKGSALGSSTLSTPTTTTHDGYRLTIVSATAFAHVVTVATGKLNAAAVTTVTFTSAAIGDSVTLVAYQGIWYLIAKTGTITLS